ncbi:hypothetical protein A2U01_0066233 [Trifolium medium]|uniref:Uncharacterized protein n=1 Tax=Trifolium medium TaxID=97028 RepID=A0A392S9Y5_9FABA|nr:hypothetical protein [Trifolium medium]
MYQNSRRKMRSKEQPKKATKPAPYRTTSNHRRKKRAPPRNNSRSAAKHHSVEVLPLQI